MQMTGASVGDVYHLMKNCLQRVDGVEIAKFGEYLIANCVLN
jgi:hypothetical protein